MKVNNGTEITWKVSNIGCHLVDSHLPTKKGYIRMNIEGRRQYLHRYLYELKFEKLKPDIEVRHKCDNRNCINIEHLESGTHQENMNDCVERDRKFKPKGSLNNLSKLTESQVIEIRNAYEMGIVSYSKLANKYKVSKTTIYRVIRYKNWNHV